MHGMRSNKTGFTIVELLIVIVIIGILAALVIVAYTGIQNRANDTSVQADLSNIGKKIELYNAQEGAYPTGGQASSGALDLKVAKSAYRDTYNMLFCVISGTSSQRFAIIATSQSGKSFIYSSQGGLKTFTGSITGYVDTCTGAGVNGAESGFWGTWGYNGNGSGAWLSWIKG